MIAARLPILALAMASLLLALCGGLARLGLPIGGPLPASAVVLHGPLLLVGFLGTLIGLERAVGFGRRWGYAAPVLAGASALAAVLVSDAVPVRAASAISGALLTAMLWIGLRGPHTAPARAQIAGAACSAAGGALWTAGVAIPQLVPWWSAFLVLTIAGERLELSRIVAPPTAALRALAAALLCVVAGTALTLAAPAAGARVAGLGWIGLGLWLARWDLARKSLRRGGLPQFMARTLLAGYAWLAVAGALALAFGAPQAGPRYDAILHAFFLGFVFAMIFAHAPVIFPAVVGRPIPFRPRFYAHVVLLHAGLALRIAGDLAGAVEVRQWGGALNVAAVLVFGLSTATSIGRPTQELRPIATKPIAPP